MTTTPDKESYGTEPGRKTVGDSCEISLVFVTVSFVQKRNVRSGIESFWSAVDRENLIPF